MWEGVPFFVGEGAAVEVYEAIDDIQWDSIPLNCCDQGLGTTKGRWVIVNLYAVVLEL